MTNLRESDAVNELEDRSDGIILGCIARVFQAAGALGGTAYTLKSISENGFSLDSVFAAVITVGTPLILEWIIRSATQTTNEIYDRESGVVDD